MAITWCSETLRRELQQFVDYANQTGKHLVLHLFTNASITNLGCLTDCAQFDEPTFPGYSSCTLQNWSDAAVDDGVACRYITTADPCQFCRTDTGACQTVYGVYLTWEDDDSCAGFAVVWPDGITFCNACDCYRVTVSKTETTG